jgi:hypothetical protein
VCNLSGLQCILDYVAGNGVPEILNLNVTTPTTFTAAVPEPSIWLMMIAGLFGLGFMAYRRTDHGSALRVKRVAFRVRKPASGRPFLSTFLSSIGRVTSLAGMTKALHLETMPIDDLWQLYEQVGRRWPNN